MKNKRICKRCKHLKEQHKEYERAKLDHCESKIKYTFWQCDNSGCKCICSDEDFEK